ncbi:TPA: sodium:alanine symporter family protein, partial [Candidatus Galligastranaerophilus intestinigallinarum]|nr:sodium:alanine symporter family protein [Candidatus Galligastranaerophilus intestinigallinarum]
MEAFLYPFVVKFNEYLSNYILVFLLVAVGVWFTVKTKFIQIRCFFDGIKNLFGEFHIFDKNHPHSMTSFQALATSIAAQVGTGNIVGA